MSTKKGEKSHTKAGLRLTQLSNRKENKTKKRPLSGDHEAPYQRKFELNLGCQAQINAKKAIQDSTRKGKTLA